MKLTDPTTWDFEDQEDLELLQDLSLMLIESDYNVKLDLENKEISVYYDDELLGSVVVENDIYYWTSIDEEEINFEYADDVFEAISGEMNERSD